MIILSKKIINHYLLKYLIKKKKKKKKIKKKIKISNFNEKKK